MVLKKKKNTLNQPVISPTCHLGKQRGGNKKNDSNLCCQTHKNVSTEIHLSTRESKALYSHETSVQCANITLRV